MLSLTDLFHELHIPFVSEGHEHCRPGWVQTDCVCSPGWGHFRLGWNLAYLYCSCWACGSKQAIPTLALLANKSQGYCRDVFKQVPRERTRREELPQRSIKIPYGVGELRKAHISYLKGRGFDPEQLEKIWGVQGIGPAPRLQWRIFIPVIHRSKTVSWTTRALADGGPRYISARPEEESLHHKRLLYGEDFIRHTAVICEGPFDAMRVGPGAVATFGVSFTRAQVLRLSRYPVRVICYDAGEEGRRKAAELTKLLGAFPGKTYDVLLDAEDPGSASPKEIQRLRKEFSL